MCLIKLKYRFSISFYHEHEETRQRNDEFHALGNPSCNATILERTNRNPLVMDVCDQSILSIDFCLLSER
jgi:hypothetical protein